MAVTVGANTDDFREIMGEPRAEGDSVTVKVILNGLWWQNSGDKTEWVSQVRVDFVKQEHLKPTVAKLMPPLEATPTKTGVAGHCRSQSTLILTFDKPAVPVTLALLRKERAYIRYEPKAD